MVKRLSLHLLAAITTFTIGVAYYSICQTGKSWFSVESPERAVSTPHVEVSIHPAPPLSLSYVTVRNKDPFQRFSFKVEAHSQSLVPIRGFSLAYGWRCDNGGHGNGVMNVEGLIVPGQKMMLWLDGCRFGNRVEEVTMTLTHVDYADGSVWEQ